jgi:hypothetical protein
MFSANPALPIHAWFEERTGTNPPDPAVPMPYGSCAIAPEHRRMTMAA